MAITSTMMDARAENATRLAIIRRARREDIRLEPSERAPLWNDAKKTLDYPVCCPVADCGRLVGWRHCDPENQEMPEDRAPPAYWHHNPGLVCTTCSEAARRFEWLLHVLRDIAFQHSEAAKASERFAPGPPGSDQRFAPFSRELEGLRDAHARFTGFERRSDVVMNRSHQAYKAHFFSFIHCRAALLNPHAKTDIQGPSLSFQGPLEAHPESISAIAGFALWSYEQLASASPCGVAPEHVTGRWREIANDCVLGDPSGAVYRTAPIERQAIENERFSVALRKIKAWNVESDNACLALVTDRSSP